MISGFSAHADQRSKNEWRNATIGSGAVTGYGLLKHNRTLVILGGLGTGYSASRYETDRHHQSLKQSRRDKWRRLHDNYHERNRLVPFLPYYNRNHNQDYDRHNDYDFYSNHRYNYEHDHR